MAPVLRAQDPWDLNPRKHARSKQMRPPETCPGGDSPPDLTRLSKLSGSAHFLGDHNGSIDAVITSRPKATHRSRTLGVPVRDVVTEREDIFATHYHADSNSPVTLSPTIARSVSRQEGSADDRGKSDSSIRNGTAATMATTTTKPLPTRCNSVDFSPALHEYLHDSPTSSAPLFRDPSIFHDTPPQSRSEKNSPAAQYNRRSLYDFHDFSSLTAKILHNIQHNGAQLPTTPQTRKESLPITPIPGVQSHDYAQDLSQSAERQSYRSWRTGQAKVNGMTIAESQRTQNKTEKHIDAQLPQPEPLMANVRSRKASHYLGLFRENDAEERRDNEQKKAGKIKDGRTDKDGVTSNQAWQAREPTISEDVESEEDGNSVTVSEERMSHTLPIGLLEEIRNNQHLVPGPASRKTPNPKHVPSKGLEHRVNALIQNGSKSEDEESDREHISSATYFPHQGVTLGDSPTEDQLTKREPKAKAELKTVSDKDSTGNVQVSLNSEDGRDYLQGISRAPSTTDFEPLPQPALPADYKSDSDYESDAYGYDSTASGEDEEDDVETTPTATPLVKAIDQRSPPQRRRQHSPTPMNAVELKPYKHQVGGHTTMFSFSRRAVCKQLNSKENMFYETVEKNHPDLLGFMPRYIGVLNVTYRKETKRRKQNSSEESQSQEVDSKSEADGQQSKSGNGNSATSAPRLISHSLQQTSSSIPQVIFENNRHLIPDELFHLRHRSKTPDLPRAQSSPVIPGGSEDHDDSPADSRRPSLKPASSWGFTTRNDKLRDHVLREVFTPPVIHKHDRRDRAYHGRALHKYSKPVQEEISGTRQKSVDIPSTRRYEALTKSDQPMLAIPRRLSRRDNENGLERATSNVEQLLQDSRAALSRSADMSEDPVPTGGSSRQHRRRHSGGGLTRKPTDIDGSRGDLEFHEDEHYSAADAEEDVFAMDDVRRKESLTKQDSKVGPVEESTSSVSNDLGPASPGAPADKYSAPRLGPAIDLGAPGPRNPETSLVQHDERVEHFLLLEDLTAGMQKPCVLDLKMGTRQYGVEANEKKQASQRMKCKTTTSRELGVRVCGMQVYNVKSQKYSFEDKYFGRDLKAGMEFREALKRFFFDGIGHAQAIKHVPTILEKITALERIIRQLPRYRLYASSLLMIYDRGDADEAGRLRPCSPREDGKPAQYPDIKLKIVDFANCVTAEDADVVRGKPCPPRHFEQIDRGYLRGLRSLRLYFQKILVELQVDRHVERGEGEGMAVEGMRGVGAGAGGKGWMEGFAEEDAGEVSI
ncbi:unnamed protein product [Zymoseptoria tritici ST99CH_1A5]|uniref:Kinase n=4 Tax=Zymoseptoria tritici TaxID=1047171 RepID=F9XJL3_ZYMTI|nr:uncharacterized protein MYCGRDRAFT_95859 [Zymoseptoria tritici IPO323]SMQ54227.1 unnamed protein product [Zymoseptoria tritici ST99CH_3D7]SMR58654.1 unnamed protein product [Zymoseptoria tritici ST99CH_1E4]SMR61653.1 unnamed protein product [Zymoseptoria tritici ST99CH_3D1]SMY27866.1 unnamed protein product [Zymoseptoria tritici ST99CH_1A5]EGP84449.1 hypothetical protein MYCGRDRAFT_95859 [Zymoseptoria tritici IPO323]